VELDAVPPHAVVPPEHSTVADAVDTLTGPDTAATPAAGSVVESRSDTVVSAWAAQPAPAPWAVHSDEPVDSRTPVMSPEAAPDVVDSPEPVQPTVSQSTRAPARLDAANSCPTGVTTKVPSAARSTLGAPGPSSVACEPDSTPHPPPVASHDAAPWV